MWCPECKNEYREGITRCADCDVDLVDELPEESAEDIDFSALEGVVPDDVLAQMKDTDANTMDSSELEDAVEEITDNLKVSKSNVYVKNADKYNDFKFSGYSFIGFAIIGLLFVLLNVLKVIEFLTTFSAIIMTALFILFIIIGISSLITASRLKASIGEEETQIDKMKTWIAEHFTEEYFTALKDEELSEEDQYFVYSDNMNRDIQKEFTEVDTTLLEELTDECLNEYLS